MRVALEVLRPRVSSHVGIESPWSAYWMLTKPEVNFLILIATCAGYCLGSPGRQWFATYGLLPTLLGTLLVASGAATLNQYLERQFDAEMRRTQRRPIAAGRVAPAGAAWFGAGLATIGVAWLGIATNCLAAVLGLSTLLLYLCAYTPLKRRTPLCTVVGAIAGAMPPLIGWAAAGGRLDAMAAWLLWALLFLWQFPHFMAIAWMYREDYVRAAYRVLPRRGSAQFLAWMTIPASIMLPLIGTALNLVNRGSLAAYIASLFLGVGFLGYAMAMVLERTGPAARRVLTASVVYLPLQLLTLLF